MIRRIALALLTLRSSLLSSSQFYGQEWLILFLAVAYLYAFVVRLRLFDDEPVVATGPGYRRADAAVAVLFALFIVIVAFGSPA